MGQLVLPNALYSTVFKEDRGQREDTKKEEEQAQPTYIPVVGESEPELKQVGQGEPHKRKMEQSQLATDDFHYDKYRKKVRRF